jgi:hypothetical protein
MVLDLRLTGRGDYEKALWGNAYKSRRLYPP